MKPDNPQCILARDKDGVFYEIPVDEARKYALPLNGLPRALEFYTQEPTGQEGLLWRKMTGWGIGA